jgi:hypothetical protein
MSNYDKQYQKETDYLALQTKTAGLDAQGRPQTMYDNLGKYYDPFEFNKNFDSYIDKVEKDRLETQNILTDELDKIENTKIYPYELPISKILVNTKNTWLDLFTGNITNDSIFYIAITFILISILYIYLSYIFT